MPKTTDSEAAEAETTEDNDKTVVPSTMASRRRERLEREAREGVPQPRRLGLRAGDDAETDLVIVYAGRGDRVVQGLTITDPRPPKR